MRRLILLLACLLWAPAVVVAQSTVFIVRHAERADAGMPAAPGADPDLSEAGRVRAESLSGMLKAARITQIYVTEFKRTRQTAEPLAKLLRIEPVVVSSKDTVGLLQRLKDATGNVLVVGHTNTIPGILKAFGAEDGVTIGESDYDNLFVVTRGTSPSIVRLHYR